MNIAICESRQTDFIRLKDTVDSFRKNQPEGTLALHHYPEHFSLISDLKHHPFDVFILCMDTLGLHGIETVRFIRKLKPKSWIVCLGEKFDSLEELIQLKIYAYLPKPFHPQRLFDLFHEVQREQTQLMTYELKLKHGERFQFKLEQLVFAEIKNHKMYYHLKNGSVYTSRETMESLSKRFGDHPFIKQISKSFIVNLHHIERMEWCRIIVSSGTDISISRKNYGMIKQLWKEIRENKT